MSSPDHRVASDRIRFARAYAAQRLPWFGPVLFRCRIIVTEAVSVASIDLNYNVYWNPMVVDKIWSEESELASLKQLGFLWIHEVSHRLRQHAERRTSLQTKLPVPSFTWNIAADFEINDNPWPGLDMPAAYPGMLPSEHNFPSGRLAEEYLTWMQESGKEFAILPDEGSGIHGESRPWETGDSQDLSDLDTEMIRRQVADEMKKAGPSAIPASWRTWSDGVLTSKTNWRRSLSHRMSVAIQRGIGSRIDYSFSKPSRRQAVYHPILTPSLRGDRTARIAIVVDTSGSMRANNLERALAEVAGVVRTFQYPVTIIPCDNRTFEPVRIVAAAEAYKVKSLPGGGLTDMRAGIAEAEKLRPKPDVILVLTDGYTPYPEQRGAVPVVFGILVGEEGNIEDIPLPPRPPHSESSVLLIKP